MDYSWLDLLELLGSLGLFLYGMKVMSDALMDLAGDSMRKILATMTSNRFISILTGFSITAIIQSSSATTLMVVSFTNASLLTLTEAIGVIMGANIGTTVTAWLITLLGFKVSMSAIALPLVGLGFLMNFSNKSRVKNWGSFVIGFALLFIGLQFLKDAVPNIKDTPEVLEFLHVYTDLGFWSILLFLGIGTLLTIIIQSSSATMAITLVMTAQGWIPFPLAAAMVLGENIGTTITANLAAIVSNFQAKRTARAHLIFNLIGVIWILLLFYPFLNGVAKVTEFTGAGSPFYVVATIPVGLSLFHTFFNICNTFLLVWFIKPIERIVIWFVKEPPLVPKAIDEPKFLSRDALKYPETLIAALENETKRLYENSLFEIVSHALNLHREDIVSSQKVKKVVKKSTSDLGINVEELYLAKVKKIYGEIIRYASRGESELTLTSNQVDTLAKLRVANRKMVEIIRDVEMVSKNLRRYATSENQFVIREYDKFRRQMVLALRFIYRFRTDKNTQMEYSKKLNDLKSKAKARIHKHQKSINKVIKNDLVTVDMGSSLVNDSDHLNDSIKKLIDVAEILYSGRDTILDNDQSQN